MIAQEAWQRWMTIVKILYKISDHSSYPSQMSVMSYEILIPTSTSLFTYHGQIGILWNLSK